jgi:orotidine-5'-phosphate decarboxylase
VSEQARSRLCFALDYPDRQSAVSAARGVVEHVGVFKVGLELFVKEGPSVVADVVELGRPVFLDLKLHDIPATVAGAVRSAARLGVHYLTLHASGGPTMLAAAAEAAKGSTLRLLGVTVLTSMDDAELTSIGVSSSSADQVRRLAHLVSSAGLAGLVCSTAEVRDLRTLMGPDPVLVTPGIRPLGSDAGDQRRTGSPGEAVRDGASLLVVGRPIRNAKVPADAARAIVAEMAAALTEPGS